MNSNYHEKSREEKKKMFWLDLYLCCELLGVKNSLSFLELTLYSSVEIIYINTIFSSTTKKWWRRGLWEGERKIVFLFVCVFFALFLRKFIEIFEFFQWFLSLYPPYFVNNYHFLLLTLETLCFDPWWSKKFRQDQL